MDKLIVLPCIKFPLLHFVHYTKLYSTVAVHFCTSDFLSNFSICDQLTDFFSSLLLFSNISISSPISYKYFSLGLKFAIACMINPLHADVGSADDKPKFSNFVKNFWYSKFRCHIWMQHEHCIKMSTNMPSIGPVILEIAHEFGEKSSKFQIFLTKIFSKHVKHKPQAWKLKTPAKNAVFW